jgi:hypothetical protein
MEATVAPETYESEVLDHLGLVAGMYDELQIGDRIDEHIAQDFEERGVSIGQAAGGHGNQPWKSTGSGLPIGLFI